jgi:superfamily I DNA/RNA helicase
MIEFTVEQQAYIESDINSSIFLSACPGSGKTEIVAAKVAREAISWNKFPGGMAVLSFSNSATDELKGRVAKHLPAGRGIFPHFLGTFDSFIYKNIVNPMVNKLTDYNGQNRDCSLRVVDGASNFFGFRTKYKMERQGHICAHHYAFSVKDKRLLFETGKTPTNRLLNSTNFLDWQVEDLNQAKNSMLSAGFATYRDVENLAIKALDSEDCKEFVQLFTRRYPLIIVDECQDLSFEQLVILQKLLDAGSIVHFVGDLHQAIYGFRDVEPESVNQFCINNNFKCLELTRNFRSCQRIIDFCGLLTKRDNIIGQVTRLEPSCYLAQYDNCPTELIPQLEGLSEGHLNNVLVARGHSILLKFQTSASDLNAIKKLALSLKLFDSENMNTLEESLKLFSEFIRHYLKESVKPNSFNCPQSIESSLSWRRFLFFSLSHLTEHSHLLKDMEIGWSKWVSKAKQILQHLPEQSFIEEDIQSAIASLSSASYKAPQGQASEIVNTSLGNNTRFNFSYRKTTIHGVKGETHDVTVLVSSPKATGSPESHWKNWLKNPDNEAARFAYVASSRPKYRLIWAVKTLNKVELQSFEKMGFHIL